MSSEIMIYEQPLNELLRTCLRLEHLFRQITHNIDGASEWQSRNAMNALLEVLNVINRPDLKSKITQSLTQFLIFFGQLRESPKIDTQHLDEILLQIDALLTKLNQSREKFGQELIENEFLSHVRSHLHNPGGACEFATPAYALWLQQSVEVRKRDLYQWANHLSLLVQIVELILRVTRQSAVPQAAVAHQAHYQQTLNANKTCSLVRVHLPLPLNVFPKISVGKHHLSIQFLKQNLAENSRAESYQAELPFQISCCYL